MASPIALSAPGKAGSGGDGFKRAQLEVRDPPKSGKTTPGPHRSNINFQFNPKELKIAKSAKWKRESQRNRRSSSVPEFSGSDPVKLTLEMFLDETDESDTTNKASVVDTVEQLFSLVVPTKESLSAGKACPPVAIFRWGGMTGFVAYVSQVDVTYSLFSPGGTPIRATAKVTLEELSPEFPPQNPSSGTDRVHSTHRTIEGDSLATLAYREYGDSTRWRDIAELNAMNDPMRLLPGTTLLLPAPDDLTTRGTAGA